MVREPLVHLHDVADVQMRDVGWVDGVPMEGRQGLPHVHLGLTRPEHVKKDIENTLINFKPILTERGACIFLGTKLLMISGAVSAKALVLNRLFLLVHQSLLRVVQNTGER